MSTAASSASPITHRSHSTSQSHSSYRPTPVDLPHRTRSTAMRPPNSSNTHHRSGSRSHTYDRPPPSNQAALANLARQDHEVSNVARPTTSRRTSSRDPSEEPPPSYRTEASRTHRRTSSRHNHSRNSTDMTGPGMAAVDGPSADHTSHHLMPNGSSSQPKRRTTINAPSGQWALGKTIGAGSMGKVKLAKNLETGEQVRRWRKFLLQLNRGCC